MKNKIKFGDYRINIDTIFGYYLIEQGYPVKHGIEIERIVDNKLKHNSFFYSSESEAYKALIESDILLLTGKIKIGETRFTKDSLSCYYIDDINNNNECIVIERMINNSIFTDTIPFNDEKERDDNLKKLDDLFLLNPINEARKMKLKELNTK